jgi:hypothetical protein
MQRSPMFRSRKTPALIVAAVLALAGCGSTTATNPTAASPATTTDTFSGSLVQGGSGINSFTVSATGTVTIELTSVTPLATMSLGVGIGTWDGTTCGTSMSANTDARSGATALTGTATAGNYCVRVYDSGNVPADWSVDYTVQVVHP